MNDTSASMDLDLNATEYDPNRSTTMTMQSNSNIETDTLANDNENGTDQTELLVKQLQMEKELLMKEIEQLKLDLVKKDEQLAAVKQNFDQPDSLSMEKFNELKSQNENLLKQYNQYKVNYFSLNLNLA